MVFSLSTAKVSQALATWTGSKAIEDTINADTQSGVGFGGPSIRIDTDKLPKEFLQHLLDTTSLSDKTRASLYAVVHGVTIDSDMTCSSPRDVDIMFKALKEQGHYNIEVQLADRWYPVKAKSRYNAPLNGHEAYTEITIPVDLGGYITNVNRIISQTDFMDDGGLPRTMTGKQVLKVIDLRHLQTDIPAHQTRCTRAATLNERTGRVMDVTGNVLATSTGAFGGVSLVIFPLGSATEPSPVVIDSTLELTHSRRDNVEQGITPLPFIRAFSITTKRWVYVDVDDTQTHHFDRTANERLVLPSKEHRMLDKLFNADIGSLFGDIVRGKHGGMIILANGPTGVGKTLTAEVFAEMTSRPLYVMEIVELGTQPSNIERNLETIFARVTRWNAVLLLDEADILLSERGSNLERAVIVGIFLRLMDYYRGLLVMTSNRADMIDPAFKSRITLRIDYPTLDRAARERIWYIMLEMAGVQVSGGLDGIPDIELNGREIRNLVRLIKVIHGHKVLAQDVKDICAFAVK